MESTFLDPSLQCEWPIVDTLVDRMTRFYSEPIIKADVQGIWAVHLKN